MELGARLCTPARPSCEECPVAAYCAAHVAGVEEARPVRKPKKTPPHREMAAAAIVRDGAYLIVQRPPEGLLGGLWELPCGEVKPGETHQAALRRICRETLGATARPGGTVATVKHAYTHFKITLTVYRCTLAAEPQALTHTKLPGPRPRPSTTTHSTRRTRNSCTCCEPRLPEFVYGFALRWRSINAMICSQS